MRLLMIHCSYFKYEVKARGRSSIAESISSSRARGEARDLLLVLVSVEKRDEENLLKACQKAAEEVSRHCKRIGVGSVVIHSFAHLFADLSSPQAALEATMKLEELLKARGYQVKRTPFGWFHEVELKAKGHPLSRVARQV